MCIVTGKGLNNQRLFKGAAAGRGGSHGPLCPPPPPPWKRPWHAWSVQVVNTLIFKMASVINQADKHTKTHYPVLRDWCLDTIVECIGHMLGGGGDPGVCN